MVDLVLDRLPGDPATRTETAIIAKSTATDRHRAINIGTGEAGINAHLLNAMSKSRAQKCIVSKVA